MSVLGVYLESRRDRPLHLTAWIADRAHHQGAKPWTTGACRPLCGRVGDGWNLVSSNKTDRRPRPVCRGCSRVLADLQSDLTVALGRMGQTS